MIVCVIAQKGGVGKTSTTSAMGAGLAKHGKRVLMVDLDSQGSLSSIVGANMQGVTMLEVLKRKATAAEAVQKGAGFDIIPASEGLAVDGLLTSTGKEYRLQEALQPIEKDYDFILLDCPPSLEILTVCALTASSSCIVPAQADFLSLQALKQLFPTIQVIRQYTNKNLTIMGILLTRFNGRAVLSRDYAEMIEDQAKTMGTKVFKTRIRESISIKEAQAMRQDIFSYAPKSNGAKDYSSFIDELGV